MRNILSKLILLLIIPLGFPYLSLGQYITTIARTGTAALSKDWNNKGLEINAWLSDLTLDTSGNIYFTDCVMNQIKKIDINTGLTTVIAGNGERGYTGDNGPAINATVGWPCGIKIDKSGNILFTQFDLNKIRKIDTKTGIITLIAGDTGVGWDYSGDGGPAVKALLKGPTNLCLDDSDNIYITDTYNARIRKISSHTKLIQTIAGNGIHETTGNGGPAINAGIISPIGITIDKSNNLYISSRYEKYLRRINLNSGLIDSTKIQGSENITFEDSNKIWSANECSIIRTNFKNNSTQTIAGKADLCGYYGDGGLAINAKIEWGGSVAVDTKRGYIYFIDDGNQRIRMVSNSPTPAPNVVSPVFYCLNSPLTLTASGTNLKWYSTAIGGIGSSIAPVIDYRYSGLEGLGDTLVYFVSQEIGGFESVRVPVVIYPKFTPSAPIPPNDNITYCINQKPSRLFVAGGNKITWYIDSLKSAPFKTAPLPVTTTKGDSYFYVSDTHPNGCESKLKEIKVSVRQADLPLFKSPINLCLGKKPEVLEATGKNIRWYSSLVNDPGSFVAPVLSTARIGQTVYYITQTDSFGCTSDTGIIDVYVNPNPSKPLVKKLYQYCLNDKAEKLYGIGVDLKWYSADSTLLGSQAPVPDTRQPLGQVYYAIQTSTLGCESDWAMVEVMTNHKPNLIIEEKIVKPYTGLPVTLKSSSDFGKSFYWSTGDTIDSISFTPKDEGRYHFWVQSSSEQGCKSDTIWHYVDILPSEYWNSQFEVHPNPFKSHLAITNINLKDVMSVQLYMLNGIKVFQSEIPLKSLEVNLPENLSSGYYILEVSTVGHAHPSRLLFKE